MFIMLELFRCYGTELNILGCLYIYICSWQAHAYVRERSQRGTHVHELSNDL